MLSSLRRKKTLFLGFTILILGLLVFSSCFLVWATWLRPGPGGHAWGDSKYPPAWLTFYKPAYSFIQDEVHDSLLAQANKNIEDQLFATYDFPKSETSINPNSTNNSQLVQQKNTPQPSTPPVPTLATNTAPAPVPAPAPVTAPTTITTQKADTAPVSTNPTPTTVINTSQQAQGPTDSTPKSTVGVAYVPDEEVRALAISEELLGLNADAQNKMIAGVQSNIFSAGFPQPTVELAVRKKIIETAFAALGHPYILENPNPPDSFNCSIFVEYCYKQVGLTLPAPSQNQWSTFGRKDDGVDQGILLSADSLEKKLVPGDVLFFIGSTTISGGVANPPPGHVGIYVGDGKFIHASGHVRGVVMDSLDTRSDIWGWGNLSDLLAKVTKTP